MAYYGSINNNFNVRELRSQDDTAMSSLISYSQNLFYGVPSNSSWISSSQLRTRAAADNIYGFALVHRNRGLIAYKEFYHDMSTSSECLVLTYNFEKSGNKNRVGNRLENWIRDDVSEFSHIDKIYFQSNGNVTSASSAFATRWSGKTKNRFTQVKRDNSMVTHPHYSVLVTL